MSVLSRSLKYMCNNTGFCWVVRRILPWRFRRMMVLSGFFGLLASLDEPLKAHATDLSKVLHLSKDHNSVMVPIHLHSILVSRFNNLNIPVEGRNVSINDVLNGPLDESTRKALSNQMATMVAPSLRYSHLNCMAYDFYRLLGFIGQLKA